MAGSMGMTGEIKVTRLRELALTKRIPFVWLLDSAGARIQEAVGSLFAGSGHLFREEVVMSGVIPQVAALMGPVRGRHRVHPRPRRLRADGQGPRLDGARRAAPRARGDRRGRHPGGARRLARALPQVAASATSRSADDEECIERIKQYLSYMPSHCERARRRSCACERPDRPRRRGAARRAARVQPQALRHVRGDPADRRRRRVLRHEAAVGEDDHHLPRALRRPAGAASSPTSPSSSAASSTTTPPTRPRASSTSATRSGSRSCS